MADLRRASAVVAASLIAAACSAGSTPSADPASTTTSSAGPSTESSTGSPSSVTDPPAPAAGQYDYGVFSQPERVADGSVVGVTPDGAVAYLLADDPDGETECEDAFTQRLFTVDLADADEREQVVIDGVELRGSYFLRGSDGRLALVDECEGFLRGIQVFSDQLDSVTELEGPDSDLIAYTMTWNAEGHALLGHVPSPGGQGPDFAIVSVDPDTGTREVLVESVGPVAPFAALPAGAFLIADFADSRIISADGSTVARLPEAGDARPGSGGAVLLTFGDRVRVYQDGEVSEWADFVAIDGALSPDVTTAAVRRLVEEGDPDLLLVGPGVGRPVRVDAPARTAVWLPDGSGLLYSTFSQVGSTSFRISFERA